MYIYIHNYTYIYIYIHTIIHIYIYTHIHTVYLLLGKDAGLGKMEHQLKHFCSTKKSGEFPPIHGILGFFGGLY